MPDASLSLLPKNHKKIILVYHSTRNANLYVPAIPEQTNGKESSLGSTSFFVRGCFMKHLKSGKGK